MSPQQWKRIERTGWIATIVAVLFGFYTYFNPQPTDSGTKVLVHPNPAGHVGNKVREAPVQPSEPIVRAPSVPPLELPPKPTEIRDLKIVEHAFGEILEEKRENKSVAPDTQDYKTVYRESVNLEMSGDKLINRYWSQEQAGEQAFDGTNDIRRSERYVYNCSAVLKELRPPRFLHGKVELICAAEAQCWKCNRKISRNFGKLVENDDFSRNAERVHPNREKGELAAEALQRLMARDTAYR